MRQPLGRPASNLSEPTDLDRKSRFEGFNDFVIRLVCEAKNAPIERMTEIGEVTTKAVVRALIGKVQPTSRQAFS